MSTATCAFGSGPEVRRRMSTTVRPRQIPRRCRLRRPRALHGVRMSGREDVARARTASWIGAPPCVVRLARRSRGRSRPCRAAASATGPPPADCGHRRSTRTALFVTSRPTMVTSSPLPKTRAAASGSIQMLNSADGVWLPSWIAPPMSTTRSIFASRLGMRLEEKGHVRERAERDERDRARSEASILAARKSSACSGTGSALGGGRSTPSSPVSPWASAATTSSPMSGPVRAGGDWNIRPARELEDAERVRRRLVERLVSGHRGHAEDVELRARRARGGAQARRPGPGRSR